MKDFAENVVEFNEKILGVAKPKISKPTPDSASFLISCLQEEIKEYILAYNTGNEIDCIDALIDLMYFAVGGLHRLGLTPDQMAQCGRIIHKANMDKKLGVVSRRGDGSIPDAVKPENWVSPEITIRQYLEKSEEL